MPSRPIRSATAPGAECRAEPADILRQVGERPGEIVAGLDVRRGATILAMPGGQPVRLRQQAAQRLGAAGDGRVERQHRAALRPAPAMVPDRDARTLVAENDVGEGADGAAALVEARQPADQVDQKILAKIVEIGCGEHQLAVQTPGREVGLVNQRGKVGAGNRGIHRSKPRNIVSDAPRLPASAGLPV